MPGCVWFRVAEMLGATIPEAQARMTPGELEQWVAHWQRFPMYSDQLLARQQTPAEVAANLKAILSR